MNSHLNTSLVSVNINDLWRIAIRKIARLRSRIAVGIDVSHDLQELNEHFESLPLSTSEFGLARNRVNNVLRYLKCGERGAAQYELKLLDSSVRSWADALTTSAQPHRGIRTALPSRRGG